jgi:hypothetical protein
VTCLHAALVPVVTREVGVDVGPELGVVLGEASVGAIRDAVGGLARLPADRLRAMARAGWEHARAHHTRERFAAEYRRQMLAILERFRPELWARLSG